MSVSSTMQLWFYQRECQLGDWVFADGSFSDIVNKAKTVVGVCFYINPDDKTQRLCVALKNVTNYQWGLYSSNWTAGITLADNPGYSVFDVPTLTNKSTVANITLSIANYRDETSAGDADGFKIHATGAVLYELGWQELTSGLGGYQAGTKLPWGLINTLKIIAHRNIILSDSNINLPLPHKAGATSEYTNLTELMAKVVADNAGQSKYREFYYPAASQCNSYEPGVAAGESLDDRFKAGKWFLPSCGEMARLCWWHSHNELQDTATNGIFAKHIAEGIFTSLGATTSPYCTSTEFAGTFSWYVTTGCYVNNNGAKNSASPARPICAF